MQLIYLLIFYLTIVSTVNSEKKVANNVHGLSRLFIFPGTKWCGPGNIAEHDYDLGSDKEVDTCCRNHDLCQPKIGAGETKYGIVNREKTSLLSCTCDEVFLNCLKAVNSWNSQIIKNIYFDMLGRQCFHYNAENHGEIEN